MPAGPESALDFAFAHGGAGSTLPPAHRQALGLFLRHLARGERVAQRAATLEASLAPSPRMARFLKSQARQERTHALVFDGFARALGAAPLALHDDPYRAYAGQLAAAAARGDFLDLVIGTQIVLEALGEMMLARLDRGIARRGNVLQRLRRRILAQEAAHHAFGAQIVTAALAGQPVNVRAAGEALRAYRRLAAGLIDAGAPALHFFGIAADELHSELDARLATWAGPC
jgi:hypothetical protein